MRSHAVVDVDEVVEERLELGDGLGGVVCVEPSFLGLLEPFHLPACLGVIGPRVPQTHPSDSIGGPHPIWRSWTAYSDA